MSSAARKGVVDTVENDNKEHVSITHVKKRLSGEMEIAISLVFHELFTPATMAPSPPQAQL